MSLVIFENCLDTFIFILLQALRYDWQIYSQQSTETSERPNLVALPYTLNQRISHHTTICHCAQVEALNRFIVGQDDAKRAVAVALRNRWRRHKVSSPMHEEIVPKNILMIGPTGTLETFAAGPGGPAPGYL